jgi:hypothetical protein
LVIKLLSREPTWLYSLVWRIGEGADQGKVIGVNQAGVCGGFFMPGDIH